MIATKHMGGATRIAVVIKLLIGVFLLGGMLWGWQQFRQWEILPITTVKIDGNFQHVSRHMLEKRLASYVTKGFFAVDVAGIKTQLVQLPWISKVAVRRVWPQTLVIKIVEHNAVARWGHASLITNSGVIFTPANKKSFPPGLPRLTGPDGQQFKVLARWRELNKIIARVGLSITKLSLSHRQSWDAQLSNGLELFLGQQAITRRLRRFVSVYQQVFGARGSRARYVDLRYPNGMAVHWQRHG